MARRRESPRLKPGTVVRNICSGNIAVVLSPSGENAHNTKKVRVVIVRNLGCAAWYCYAKWSLKNVERVRYLK